MHDPYVVVPVDVPSEAVRHQSAIVRDLLKSFRREPLPGPHVHILENGCYVLYGDLFKTGDTYALVELPVAFEVDPYWNGKRVAFAQLVNEDWLLRGLWDINSSWLAKEAPKKEPQDYAVELPEAPFELKDFDGDGVPEVVMAGEMWRYYQNFYLLRFDAKTKSLRMLADSMGNIQLCNGHVRLYFNSGRGDILEKWQFLKMEHGALREIVSWHDGFTDDQGGDKELWVQILGRKGKPQRYDIGFGANDGKSTSYDIKTAGGKIATITFTSKAVAAGDHAETEKPEKGWIFHHLTGFPVTCLPASEVGSQVQPLSKYESVALSGDPTFIRRMRAVDGQPSY